MERVATFASRTGLALLLAISVIGAGTLIAGDGSPLLIAEGVLMIAAVVLFLVRVQLAVRVFRTRYAVCAMIVLFCGLGAPEHGLQPAYSSVLLALVWISAVVDSPRFVGVCVLFATEMGRGARHGWRSRPRPAGWRANARPRQTCAYARGCARLCAWSVGVVLRSRIAPAGRS